MTTGFEIDGKPYPLAMPSTFDMDEAQVFFDYTGFVVEEIWLSDLGWSDLGKRPGFLAALAHIAYRRGNENEQNDAIRLVIGKQNRLALFGSMLNALTPDEPVSEDPNELSVPDETSSSATSSETASSPNGTAKEPEGSGESSKTSSDQRGGDLATIGTSVSGGDPMLGHLRPVA